jgi:hypothetical protein
MHHSPVRPARHRSARLLHALALALALALTGAGVAPASATPSAGPSAPAPAPSPVDAYPRYDPQATCDPTAKPGAQYLLDLLVAHYKVGRKSPIARACHIGGTSEHKEGRAIDWGVNVANPAEKAAADHFVGWLTAPGPDGNVGWNARRLGVMYVIWNGQIWNNTSASATWRPYTGASPHTDHVHVSLSWGGAWQRASWWSGVALPETAATRLYVTKVYSDLFGRVPDAGGLETWTAALTSGTPRRSVADAITGSTEYRSRLITGSYREFLGRTPDPAGLQNWLGHMQNGMTIQTMESGFLASEEYFNQSGRDAATWVTRLYQHVLGRQPGQGEVDHWTGRLAAGSSRQQVALGFLLSTERLSTVVDGYYQHLLGRRIDETGRVHWVTAVQNGVRTEQIIGGIVASEEYYGNATRWSGR